MIYFILVWYENDKKGGFAMKIGLLGFGSMGRTHAYCVSVMPYFFSEHPNAKIYGVCTRNIENAKRKQ